VCPRVDGMGGRVFALGDCAGDYIYIYIYKQVSMYEEIDLGLHRYTYVLLRWAPARETIYIYI